MLFSPRNRPLFATYGRPSKTDMLNIHYLSYLSLLFPIKKLLLSANTSSNKWNVEQSVGYHQKCLDFNSSSQVMYLCDDEEVI